MQKLTLSLALIPILGSMLWSTSCGHTPALEYPNGEFDRPVSGKADDGSSLYQNAVIFDRIIRDAAKQEEIESFRENCKKSGKDNPFCHSIANWRHIKDVIAQKNRVRSPVEAKPLQPVSPEIAKGKVANWGKLRDASVPALLKGMMAISPQDFPFLVSTALKEKRCPNNMTVALAATLEDYLPNDAKPDQIAALYERAGACSRRQPQDQENFYTRAGIFYFWAKNYTAAADVLKKVRPNDTLTGRPLYWLYRASIERGDTTTAEKTFQRMLSQHRLSFHTLIAAKTRGMDPSYPETTPLKSRSARNPKVNKVIEQAEVLKRFGLDYSAAVLADWALSRFPRLEPEVVLHICLQGDSHAKAQSGTETLIFHPQLTSHQTLELIFPRPYMKAFERRAARVSPYFLLSIARKESRFNPKAVSVANAQGMMQMNPDTAAKMGHPAEKSLLDPEANIALGAEYVGKLYSDFDGNLAFILGSYNAGEHQVQNWLKRFPSRDMMLFIDLIPFRETRDYVGFVLSYYYWYRRLYEGAPAKDTLGFL